MSVLKHPLTPECGTTSKSNLKRRIADSKSNTLDLSTMFAKFGGWGRVWSNHLHAASTVKIQSLCLRILKKNNKKRHLNNNIKQFQRQ